MVGLSRIMKEKAFRFPEAITLNAVFFTSKKDFEKRKLLIDELEIQNQYCNVEFSLKDYSKYESITSRDIVFFIAESIEEIQPYLSGPCPSSYMFVLIQGKPDTFFHLSGNQYFFGFHEESFFETVFHCFLLFPLAEGLADYSVKLLNSIRDEDTRTKIKVLLSEKPVVRLSAENKVELNCSVPFDMEVYPEGAQPPELSFEYQLPGIVECTQQRIYGKREGTTKVLVYEKGEVEPLKELTVTVEKRNRVTNITLSDYALCRGVGDRFYMDMQAFPQDADNLDKLKWYSDNEDVAVVNQSGCVYVKSAGQCNIYCSVEKIYATCSLEGKPYLERIDLSEEFHADSITMTMGEEKDLCVKLTPMNAYDKNLTISSSNYMVVNIQNEILTAVGLGEADIFIENSTKRLKRRIHISVVKNSRNTRKKRGLFGLFR
jgi:hypothetical protein